jgi:hypothetical protein
MSDETRAPLVADPAALGLAGCNLAHLCPGAGGQAGSRMSWM